MCRGVGSNFIHAIFYNCLTVKLHPGVPFLCAITLCVKCTFFLFFFTTEKIRLSRREKKVKQIPDVMQMTAFKTVSRILLTWCLKQRPLTCTGGEIISRGRHNKPNLHIDSLSGWTAEYTLCSGLDWDPVTRLQFEPCLTGYLPSERKRKHTF